MKNFTFLMLMVSGLCVSQTIGIQSFATGFSGALAIENAGDDRLFVVQQGNSTTPGRIRIVNPDGTVNPTDFLSLSNSVISAGGERGLLGLAFHPDYANNGYFYVNYTRATDGATTIARYSVSANPNVADPSSWLELFTVSQPFSNHNGGSLRFGPDGYLYIGMGDGGSGNDPQNNSQNINSNLGKMLRIDVDGGSPYAIPSDNPYVGEDGSDLIWATGLRNPWKFSFDRETGDLWIADVGQNAVEEVNKVTGNGGPGLNYGWRCYEGNTSTGLGACTLPGPYTFPVATYSHSLGCSITGGFVYRGTTYPNFIGKYFFTDYCTDFIATIDSANNVVYSPGMPGSNSFRSFGEDVNGELYITNGSTVYRIIDTSLAVNDHNQGQISLSPNPAAGMFYVSAQAENYPLKISLFDIGGKMLHDEIVYSDQSAIWTTNLSSGMYVVKIQDRAGAIQNSKLAIAR